MVTREGFVKFIAARAWDYRASQYTFLSLLRDDGRGTWLSEEHCRGSRMASGEFDIPCFIMWHDMWRKSGHEIGLDEDDVAIVVVPDGKSYIYFRFDDGIFRSKVDVRSRYYDDVDFCPWELEEVDEECLEEAMRTAEVALAAAERSHRALSGFRTVDMSGMVARG